MGEAELVLDLQLRRNGKAQFFEEKCGGGRNIRSQLGDWVGA